MLTLITVGLLGAMSLLEVIRSRILVRIGGRLDQRLGDRVLAAQFTSSLQRSQRQSGPGDARLRYGAPVPDRIRHLRLLRRALGPDFPGDHLSASPHARLHRGGRRRRAVRAGPRQQRGHQEAFGEAAGKVSVSLSGAIDSSLRNAEVIEAMGMFQNFRRRLVGQAGRCPALSGPGGGSRRDRHGSHQVYPPAAADRHARRRRLARHPRADLGGLHHRVLGADGAGARSGRAGDRHLETVPRRPRLVPPPDGSAGGDSRRGRAAEQSAAPARSTQRRWRLRNTSRP